MTTAEKLAAFAKAAHEGGDRLREEAFRLSEIFGYCALVCRLKDEASRLHVMAEEMSKAAVSEAAKKSSLTESLTAACILWAKDAGL